MSGRSTVKFRMFGLLNDAGGTHGLCAKRHKTKRAVTFIVPADLAITGIRFPTFMSPSRRKAYTDAHQTGKITAFLSTRADCHASRTAPGRPDACAPRAGLGGGMALSASPPTGPDRFDPRRPPARETED